MIIEKYSDDNFHNEARNIRYNFFENVVNKYKSEIESELLGTLTTGLDSEVNEFVDDAGNKFEIKIVKNS